MSSIIQSSISLDKQEQYSRRKCTAQKIKFSIEGSPVNVTRSAGNCGFGHIYWRNRKNLILEN